jgi:hypothetical protein
MTRRAGWSLPRVAITAIALAVGVATACGYEGRSLDLFPSVPLAGDLGRCSAELECPMNRPFCAEGLCVECRSDGECRGNKPACLAGACVTCSGPEHCPLGSACNVAADRCAPACERVEDCTLREQLSCDVERGFCVECLDDATCVDPARPACDRPAGQCVACNDDGDCSGRQRACDPIRHQCVECLDASHCGGLVCDTERQRCAECSRDADCPGGTFCDPMGRCQPDCSGDAGAADAGRPGAACMSPRP